MAEALIKSFTPGNTANDRDGFVGYEFELYEPRYLSAIGRQVVHSPAGSRPHRLRVLSADTGDLLVEVFADTFGTPAGSYAWGNLTSPLLLQRGRYYAVSGETTDPTFADDPFYDHETVVTAYDGVAAIVGGVHESGGIYYPSRRADGHAFGPVNLMLAPAGASDHLLESWAVGSAVLHNDADQTSGMIFETKTKHVRVTKLRRYAKAGSSQTHVLRLYEYWTGSLIASGTVNLAGWAADGWAEVSVAPVVLAPYRQYALTSEEHNGGDYFYAGVGASVATKTQLGDDVAQVQYSVVKLGGSGTSFDGYNPGPLSIGPVDLEIEVVPAPRYLLPRVSAGVVSLESDVVEGATSYRFERSASEAGTFSPLGTSDANTFTDDAAVGGTNFYYRSVPVFDDGSEGLPSPVVKARVRRAQTDGDDPASSLSRVTSGRLARLTFDNDLPSAPTGAWSVDSSHPSLVCFAPSRKEAAIVTDLTIEGTARQVTVAVDGDLWYEFNDGGLYPGFAVSPHDTRTWGVTHFRVSTDRGLTWQKSPYTNLYHRRHDDFGEEVGHSSGCWQKFGGRWIAPQLRSVPGDETLTSGPFYGSIFAGGATPFDDFKFVRDVDGEYPSQVMKIGGTFYLLTANLTTLEIHVSTGPTETGPWSASVLLLPTGWRPENPKGGLHSYLGKVLIFANQIDMGAGSHTDRNSLFVFDNFPDPTSAKRYDFQHVCPLDALGAIGVATPVMKEEGALVEEADGSLPFTFDGDGSDGNHNFRSGRYGVLEASKKALAFNEGAGVESAYSLPLDHSDFVAEFAVELDSSSSGYVAFDFRSDGAGNGYRVVIAPGAKLKLQKLVAGVASDLAAGAGGEDVSTGYLVHRVKIVCSGQGVTASLNGTTQARATDATYGSGSHVGFAAKSCAGRVRLLAIYESSAVTVRNVAPGSRVVLRGAGDVPLAEKWAGVGETELEIAFDHYPVKSIQVEDVEIAAAGGVWGGDEYELR